jgi:hypothetical protein
VRAPVEQDLLEAFGEAYQQRVVDDVVVDADVQMQRLALNDLAVTWPSKSASFFSIELLVVLGKFDEQYGLGVAARGRLGRRPEHRDVARQPEHGAIGELDFARRFRHRFGYSPGARRGDTVTLAAE